jgi:hypothetical protein
VSTVDVDDTSRCPLGHRCESCGIERDDLAVTTAALGRLGVGCLTLCPRCTGSEVAPPVSVGTAVRLVAQHCGHLGIDLDEMAAALVMHRSATGAGRRSCRRSWRLCTSLMFSKSSASVRKPSAAHLRSHNRGGRADPSCRSSRTAWKEPPRTVAPIDFVLQVVRDLPTINPLVASTVPFCLWARREISRKVIRRFLCTEPWRSWYIGELELAQVLQILVWLNHPAITTTETCRQPNGRAGHS